MRNIILKISLLTLVAGLVFYNQAQAQGEKKNVTFSGFVIDGSNDEPLAGAYVINDKAG
ncbi:MAG: hypothetical protein IPO04_14630 [Cytophagaceae bacterium]|nr:hypothetical protein [Cytophagaceae bacterium]